ncbi:hypothetical protein BC826DRAFT_1093833 [Russula brevipes]|nr:hypothetical protein BC826DRAFT_1093833 [Russula brevipes]
MLKIATVVPYHNPPFFSSPRTPTGSPTHQAFPLTPSTPANLGDAPIRMKIRTHPYLDGQPCDEDGYDLPPSTPPPPFPDRPQDDYYPYTSLTEFELADFLFRKVQMSGNRIDELMEIWAAHQQARYNDDETTPPFANARDLYNVIDRQSSKPANAPNWMSTPYEVWFRDPLTVMEGQIGNCDFKDQVDYAPKQVFSIAKKRQFTDFMSGDWDIIAEDPETHGAMFVPVILGSDKTTVSVATGHNEYYPLYGGIGNAQNHVRRAHRNALAVIAFLAIPKTDKQFQDDVAFRKFRRQLFHSSLTRILSSLKPFMTKPQVMRCGDGYFRRVIYGLGPYIADYPEQVLLACVVSGWCPKCTASSTDLDNDMTAIIRSHTHTNALHGTFSDDLRSLWDGYGVVGDLMPFTADFPHANIHELLAPDLLHQIIKGTFKDHLVTWIMEYVTAEHGNSEANEILADIDRRIAAVPPFPALQRFPEGRGFKQWTGDDSKALMKVFLPAIVGHVPSRMVRALSAFMEFCYLVCRSEIDEDTLAAIQDAVGRFHQERQIFIEAGIHEDFSLPRQHSLTHYQDLILLFGAPNGLCSSITESKHIKAVKEPWWRSSRNQPLGQMLLTNQRLDKLAASRVNFQARGMLDKVGAADALPPPSRKPTARLQNGGDVEDVPGAISLGDVKLAHHPAPGYPQTLMVLAGHIGEPRLQEFVRRFLYDQQYPDADMCGMEVPIEACPNLPPTLHVRVYHSARATYFAPSDLSGIGGMHRESIRATPSWKKGRSRYDCVFIDDKPELNGFRGLNVAHVKMFLSFSIDGITYPCALVEWFSRHGSVPCEDTGLYSVEPDYDARGRRLASVVHVDTILCGAHLIGVSGTQLLPRTFTCDDSLDAFQVFYVNKYIDHHAHEIAW